MNPTIISIEFLLTSTYTSTFLLFITDDDFYNVSERYDFKSDACQTTAELLQHLYFLLRNLRNQ